jgi:hypothetical protein
MANAQPPIQPARPQPGDDFGLVRRQIAREWAPIDIEMNRHQLGRELDRLHTRYRERVTWEDAIPWFLGGLGFLQPLITEDFKNFLDVPSAVWKGGSAGVAVVLFLLGVRALFIAIKQSRDPIPTADDTIERLLRDMPPRDRGGSPTQTPQPPVAGNGAGLPPTTPPANP